MQYKRFKLCVLFVLSCCIKGTFAQSMLFQENTGEQNQYEIETVQKITFSADEITVSKTNGAIEVYSIGDLQHIRFPMVNLPLKLPREDMNTTFTLFPNPTVSHVTLKAFDGRNLNGTFQILSITGRSVLLLNISERSEIVIDISNLEKGIYFCRHHSAEQIQTIKLIKQ